MDDLFVYIKKKHKDENIGYNMVWRPDSSTAEKSGVIEEKADIIAPSTSRRWNR